MLQCRSTSQVTEEMPCMSKRSPSVAKDDLPVTNYPFNAGARGDSAGAASGSAYGQIIRATQVPHTTPCQAYFPLALGFNKLCQATRVLLITFIISQGGHTSKKLTVKPAPSTSTTNAMLSPQQHYIICQAKVWLAEIFSISRNKSWLSKYCCGRYHKVFSQVCNSFLT
jgi:hypothetical protein